MAEQLADAMGPVELFEHRHGAALAHQDGKATRPQFGHAFQRECHVHRITFRAVQPFGFDDVNHHCPAVKLRQMQGAVIVESQIALEPDDGCALGARRARSSLRRIRRKPSALVGHPDSSIVQKNCTRIQSLYIHTDRSHHATRLSLDVPAPCQPGAVMAAQPLAVVLTPEVRPGEEARGSLGQPSLTLSTEGVQRILWEGRFGPMLIEVVDGVCFVNHGRVEPVSPAPKR